MSKRATPFSLRVDEASLAAYKEAAERAGMTTAEWARIVLDVASGAKQIRHVYYVDVGSMEPKEALEQVRDTARRVRTGKW